MYAHLAAVSMEPTGVSAGLPVGAAASLPFRVAGRFCCASAGPENGSVAMAASEKPDLILMDMSLPVMDGWEATRQIKAAPETQDLPVIALTAHAMSGDRDRALGVGCADYHTKPVDFPKLLAQIEAILQNRAAV